MPRYTAFLRGVNISGKNKISMPELKTAFESLGYTDVKTVLNSGNVAFSVPDSDAAGIIVDEKTLRSAICSVIQVRFGVHIPVCVIKNDDLSDILSHAPDWWGTEDKETYHNLIFILTDELPEDIAGQLGLCSQGLEQYSCYGSVLFWTFCRSEYQKCRWWKQTATAGMAEKLTIRTAGTVRKTLCTRNQT